MTRSYIYYEKIHFLPFFRDFDCVTVFMVIVSPLNNSVRRNKIFRHGRLRVGFQIVKAWRAGKFFVKSHVFPIQQLPKPPRGNGNLQLLPKGESSMGRRNLSPTLNLSFLCSRSGLLLIWTNGWNLWQLLMEQTFRLFSVVNNWANSICIHSLPCNG